MLDIKVSDLNAVAASLPPYPADRIRAGMEARGVRGVSPESIPKDFVKQIAIMQAAAGGDLRGKRILDVGCGAGALLAQARSLGAEVVGVDLFTSHGGQNKPMAHAVFEAYGFDEEEAARALHTQDASLIEPETFGRFDLTISLGMLEHVPDREARRRITQAMVKVLKPGGSALMVCGPNARFPLDFFHYGPRLPLLHVLPRPAKAAYLKLFALADQTRDPDYVNGMRVSEIAGDMRAAAPVEIQNAFPLLVGATRSNRLLSNPATGAVIRAVAEALTRLQAEPVIFLIARRTA